MLKACIKYFLFYLLAFLTSWSFSGFAWGLSSGEIKEGQHYKRLDSKILSDRKIQLWQAEHPNEVWFLEFFYYGCMACQRLDGVLENYLSQKKVRNARVFFEQVPVVFRPSLENLAKAFYFAKGSSKFSELNHQLFEALLHQKINLTEIQNLKQFFMLHGFSEKEFEQKI
ncbi:MAG: glycosyl hydrolase, partial [Gammaproteobacteria bacterium]